MPRILVAPDKFKGSLTAVEVAEALRRGIIDARPELDVHTLPVADGGDGTLDAAVTAGFERVRVTATGPTGEPVETAYARRGDTAVVEMADVSGLGRLPGGRLDPLGATSRGTGEAMVAALTAGCRRLVLGIGGSASTDGGAGLLQACGARLLDVQGAELPAGGGALARLEGVDLTGLRSLEEVEIVVACDVDNPLIGPRGAAAIYGPQKGADAADITVLDRALDTWADLVAAETGRDLRDVPGAGAAGGVGFAALSVLGAQLRPGIDLILDLLEFESRLEGVDWVVVGEGSLDEQTLSGKAPVGVAKRARAAGARVVAVCGVCQVSPAALAAVGIDGAHALSEIEPDPSVSMKQAAPLVEELGRRLSASGVFVAS